jgi:hypothetical protein
LIISASRRTDLPAFYAPWFMNRIRAGFCHVPNPFNPGQVAKVSLRPEDVEVIVFWTRDPRPLLPHLAELEARGYRYYFQFTLTGYPALFEPYLPERAILTQAFRELADRIGPDKVIWRYDPLALSNLTDHAFHYRSFSSLCTELSPHTRRVVLSLLDPYAKNRRRLRKLAADGAQIQEIIEIDAPLAELLRNLSATAQARGLEIVSCAEPLDLRPYGIAPGKCIDDQYIARTFGIAVTRTKDPRQRPACGCVQSKDIGAYDSCRHGCVYCYATQNARRAARHDPDAPGL